MGELESALDALSALAADDLFEHSDADLLDRTRALVRARNMLDAELARTVRRAELAQAPERDGLKNMKSWLRTHGRLSGSAVTALVTAGRVQEALPAVAAACAAGRVTADQVELLAKTCTPQALERAAAAGVDRAAIEAALVAVAVSAPHRDLQKAVGAYLAALDPDGSEPDPTEGRSLKLVQHPDGSWTGRFDLDAVGGEKVATALEAIAAKGRCAGDLRTRDQRLGDALVQLADLQLAAGDLPVLRTVKPHVGVLIGVEDLVDPAEGPGAGTTGLGAAISAARVRMLACDGSVTRIVIGPDSVPLDLGRTQRVVPPHLRRAVDARDQCCVFTGCEAPAWWCDVHHVLHWVDGGETCLENSALLCERHHTKVHHGFTIERDDGGRWHTYRPDGSEILLHEPLRV
ncbi:HNH endonuclease signature motif containing protein [Blastococcus jejuensis]|uniref:HNH endonuclease signature motif containing protein n=1 Tax=Blastococcus jejuensis TaxID=351224 RepID=A0ABP6P8C2_9ACTN